MPLLLSGKVAIITGANQGLGLAISKKYVSAGASVVICARNSDLLATAHEVLSENISENQMVESVSIDVSDKQSIDKLVRVALDRFGRIDILVNNAGVYGAMGPIEEVDWGEWFKAIEINLLGSVLMCRAIVPVMKSQRRGKIIQLSGGGATNPMPNISAYAVSKAGVVRFAESLAEEVRRFNIDVNAIAPGALNSRLLDEVLDAGPDKVGHVFYDKSLRQKNSGGSGFDRGAELALFLASDLSNGITGKLISAVWDNWENWPEHTNELNAGDVYTLRRIVGRDRGFEWGDK
jgi:3-oxoacyl-[acyl-carrier protein] reductase